jgi:hypothetical protein
MGGKTAVVFQKLAVHMIRIVGVRAYGGIDKVIGFCQSDAPLGAGKVTAHIHNIVYPVIPQLPKDLFPILGKTAVI